MQATAHIVKPFLNEDFLLDNETARELYHNYAARQPIIDYHNHLSPQEIAEDKKFDNLTQVWLNGDHYKWRAMRTLGIDEKFITGTASDYAKFQQWAETVPQTIRNPLFHWTHLELQRYFDIHDLLRPKTAKSVYENATSLLQTPTFSTQNLLKKMNVEVVCTTDDPIDNLHHHQQLRLTQPKLAMYPAFRPDKALLINQEQFLPYIASLGEVADVDINAFDALMEALKKRLCYFHHNGCRIADHGLEQLYAEDFTHQEVDEILKRRLAGAVVSPAESQKFASAVLHHLCCLYAEYGWVQQFHLGALRNNNVRMLRKVGPDTGFDSIGDWSQACNLAKFLNRLDEGNNLAKTILYNLNPRDNEMMATMIGNFNDGSVRGKVQFGAAWWFLDQKNGMEKQLNALSNMSLLSCFIGMLTDSRSFLSFPRHEYFRRILCNLIGTEVHKGELPHDTEWLGGIVADVCYRNAKRDFDFPQLAP